MDFQKGGIIRSKMSKFYCPWSNLGLEDMSFKFEKYWGMMVALEKMPKDIISIEKLIKGYWDFLNINI